MAPSSIWKPLTISRPPSTSLPYGDDDEPEGETRTEKGLGDRMRRSVSRATDNFQAVQGTIRTYTRNTLNAFKDITDVNVDKVTLEFGVKVAGEAGVPYVTQGTAECNLKITVECSYPKEA